MTGVAPSGKANFGDIYNQRDPRGYYRTLGPLGYEIPQHGRDVFRRLLDARGAGRSRRPPTVLDVCCSYGVGGVLLTTDLDLDDLYAHYAQVAAAGLDHGALVEGDRALFARHRLPEPPRVVGLDAAANAVRYAVESGALAAAVAADLERGDPPAELADLAGDVDLITITGGVGYVAGRTFDRLLARVTSTPWVAAFCLRTYDFASVAEVLVSHGLQVERATRTFRQRRFVDAAERGWAVATLRGRGLEPIDEERDGYLRADLYVARPAADVARTPLALLLPGIG